MKKLFALLAFVAFVGVTANAQTSSAQAKKDPKAATEKASCSSSDKEVKSGSCCSAKSSASTAKAAEDKASCGSSYTSKSSCCSSSKSSGEKAEAAPAKGTKKSKAKDTAMVTKSK